MPRLLTRCLLVALAAIPAVQASGFPQESARDHLRELLALGDEATAEDLNALAALGTEKAMDALHEVVLELHARRRVLAGYRAFHVFYRFPELWPDATELLAKDALRHRRDVHKESAARALAEAGASAFPAMEGVLRKSREESVRRIVALPLIETLGWRGDRESWDLLFDNVSLSGDVRLRVLASLRWAAEAPDTQEGAVAELSRRLKDRKAGVGMQTLLLEALAGSRSEQALEAISARIEDDRPEVALRAIELLGLSGDRSRLAVLEPLTLGDDEDAVVRAAIGAMAELRGDDPTWRGDVERWSRDGRLGARLGACLALAQFTDQASSDLLHGMLEDPAWQVRVEALRQVVQLRRKSSIPILIERLGVERGRLVDDVTRSLRLMTGLDHGPRPSRWQAWWEGEGEGFQVPSLEAVLEAEEARVEKPENQRSSVGFYGLRVTSQRVTFVIDVSGSMREPAGGKKTSTPGEIRVDRLDVARRELEDAVQALADGVFFNIICFGDTVRPWQDEMVDMERRTRERAVEFTRKISFGRGTNTYGGLISALEDLRVDTVYLLSDGEPSVGEIVRPDDIRERIQLLNSVRNVRIHCISIGQESAFMRDLAGDTGGRYIEVL